jgi:hypothetical protein
MPLAMIRMSGLMAPLSSQSQANISPVLPNPVCTSSAIKRMLFLTRDEERRGGPQTGGKSLVTRGGSLEDRGHSLPHQEPTDDDDEGRCRGDQEEERHPPARGRGRQFRLEKFAFLTSAPVRPNIYSMWCKWSVLGVATKAYLAESRATISGEALPQ